MFAFRSKLASWWSVTHMRTSTSSFQGLQLTWRKGAPHLFQNFCKLFPPLSTKLTALQQRSASYTSLMFANGFFPINTACAITVNHTYSNSHCTKEKPPYKQKTGQLHHIGETPLASTTSCHHIQTDNQHW